MKSLCTATAGAVARACFLCSLALPLGAGTQQAWAQSGGAAASAGSAAATAASGQAGAAAAPGQAGTAGQAGGTGHGGNGVAGAQNQTPSGPQAYAASASPGLDPRKPPPAAPGALTLDQVVDRARRNNPTLLAAEANLRSVRANEIQAAVRANPYLAVTGSNITAGPSSNNPYQYSAQLSRLFERGDKRGLRIENAKDTTAQTAAQLEDTIRQTLLQVKTAFTHMLFAKQSLDLSEAQLADFRHEVEIGNDRYKAGDLGRLDYERLDLQLGSFESDVANDRIALQQASDQLQTLMGVERPAASFDITGAIVPPVVATPEDQLIRQALLTRPDLVAAQQGVRVAQSAYRLAVANGTTDPTLEGEYDRTPQQGTTSNNSVGFNVSIPLRIFDRNQGNKEVALLAVDTARLTETAVRNQISSDVDQAWVAYVQARGLSDRFGSHYLDESADVLGIAQFAFDHGGLALIDYLDALRDARSATSDALNAYQQTWLAIHQLSEAAATELAP